jgi:hypothetical protein
MALVSCRAARPSRASVKSVRSTAIESIILGFYAAASDAVAPLCEKER